MCGCGRGTRGRGRGVIVCCRCISSMSRACPLSRKRTKAIDRDPARKQKQVLRAFSQPANLHCCLTTTPVGPWRGASVFNQHCVDTQSRLRARKRLQQLTLAVYFVMSSSLPADLARSSFIVNFSILPLRKSRGTSFLRADVRRGRCVTPMHRQRVTRSRRRVGATRAFEFSDENGSCGEASTARGIRTPARAPRRCRSWIRGCEKSGSSNRAYSSSLIVALAATVISDVSDGPASVYS